MPDTLKVLTAVLTFLGVPEVYLYALLTLLIVRGWIAAKKTFLRRMRTIPTAVAIGGNYIARTAPLRLSILVAMAIVAVVTQAIMLRVSYAGGSLISTFFDNERGGRLLETATGAPSQFADGEFLKQFLRPDVICVCYLALTLAVLVLSYDNRRSVTLLFSAMSFPFGVAALVLLPLTLLGVFFDSVFSLIVLLAKQADVGNIRNYTYSWGLTNDYLLSPPFSTVYVVTGVYCALSFAAIIAGRSVRLLWSKENVQKSTQRERRAA